MLRLKCSGQNKCSDKNSQFKKNAQMKMISYKKMPFEMLRFSICIKTLSTLFTFTFKFIQYTSTATCPNMACMYILGFLSWLVVDNWYTKYKIDSPTPITGKY